MSNDKLRDLDILKLNILLEIRNWLLEI